MLCQYFDAINCSKGVTWYGVPGASLVLNPMGGVRRPMGQPKKVGEWLREQLTVGNILVTATFIATLTLNTGRWVTGFNQENKERDRKISETTVKISDLSVATQSLTTRIEQLERSNLQMSERVAQDFPRRSELEPRLRAIEEQLAESNRLMRSMSVRR